MLKNNSTGDGRGYRMYSVEPQHGDGDIYGNRCGGGKGYGLCFNGPDGDGQGSGWIDGWGDAWGDDGDGDGDGDDRDSLYITISVISTDVLDTVCQVVTMQTIGDHHA